MRDQRELALKCLEVEDAGGSVIEFLKGMGFISASATWQRLQLNELGRLPSKLRDGKENVNMGKLTLEDKKKAVQIAVDGGNPLEYIRSCGVKNAAEAWGNIKRVVKETDPEAFEKIPKRLPNPKNPIVIDTPKGMQRLASLCICFCRISYTPALRLASVLARPPSMLMTGSRLRQRSYSCR